MLDEKLRQMLRDLGRALSDAISDSPEVGRTLRRIRREGYTLDLLVDCTREGETAAAPVASGGATAGDPVFRINSDDLSFLKSIGIDPTRRRRRRA